MAIFWTQIFTLWQHLGHWCIAQYFIAWYDRIQAPFAGYPYIMEFMVMQDIPSYLSKIQGLMIHGEPISRMLGANK